MRWQKTEFLSIIYAITGKDRYDLIREKREFDFFDLVIPTVLHYHQSYLESL